LIAVGTFKRLALLLEPFVLSPFPCPSPSPSFSESEYSFSLLSLPTSPILGEERGEDVGDVDNEVVCDTGRPALVAVAIVVDDLVVFVAAAKHVSATAAVFVFVFTCPIVADFAVDDAVVVVVDVAPAYPFFNFLGWPEGVVIVINVDVAVATVDDVVTTGANGVGCTVSSCVNVFD